MIVIVIGAIGTSGTFGQGIGPILLDDVGCTGFEYRLFDCPNRGMEVTNCGHHQDAGVTCLPGKLTNGKLELVACYEPA